MYRLNDKEKRLTRKLAANNWNKAADHASDWDHRKELAMQWTKDDIQANRQGFGAGRRGLFSSIVVTFLLGLAVRFAAFLITKWWENMFSSVDPDAEDVNE